MPQLSLTDAALQLGLTYQQVRDRLLKGQLRGGRNPEGRLYVEAAGVAQLKNERVADPPEESGKRA